MNILYEQTLKIVNAAIHKTILDDLKVEDWSKVLSYLSKGKMDAMASGLFAKLSEDDRPAPEILLYLKNSSTGRAVAQMEAVRQLKYVFEEAGKRGIKLINFKGLTLATLYPEPFMRFTSDYDLLVSNTQKEAAKSMFVEMGFVCDKEDSKDHVPVYKKGRLVVELHDCLWEDYTGKQADLLDKYKLDAEDKLLKMNAFGIEYTTLGYTEHLVYQVFHAAKHLAFEDINLRFFTDMMLYVDKYHEKIDFDLFWDELRELKYDAFCAAFFRIGEEWLGMQQRILPKEYADSPINERLLEVTMERSKGSQKGIEKFASVGFVSAYFMRDLTWEGDNTSKTSKILFPSPNQLKEKYAYAKKHHILLPIAWCHRFINAVSYSVLCKRKGYKSTDILKVADDRINLLDELKMLDTTH